MHSHPEPDMVTMTISRQAAAFLHGTAVHLNQVKALPDTPTEQSVQTSAWLEEIESAASKAARS